MPMATPPTMRQAMKALKLCAQPVRIDDTPNNKAATISKVRLPVRSASTPDRIEPSRQPKRAQLLAQPIMASDVR